MPLVTLTRAALDVSLTLSLTRNPRVSDRPVYPTVGDRQLPELAELIAAIEGGAGGGQAPMPRQMASEGQMGALGGMG